MPDVFEYPCNWRRLRSLLDGVAPEKEGEPPVSSDHAVFLETGFDLTEVRNWLAANTRLPCGLYARLEVEQFAYRIQRVVLGANFRFLSGDDAFYFKMRF